MNTPKRYTKVQLQGVLEAVERLDKDGSGATREAVFDEITQTFSVHSDRQRVYDIIKHLEMSGDLLRCGIGHRYRSIVPLVSPLSSRDTGFPKAASEKERAELDAEIAAFPASNGICTACNHRLSEHDITGCNVESSPGVFCACPSRLRSDPESEMRHMGPDQ